jgi:tetraacyldisaccharide 4'-kinase
MKKKGIDWQKWARNPLVRLVTLPLSWGYAVIVLLRNWGYDIGVFGRNQPLIPTISVGNLTVGGTGKTPFIEYLIHSLGASYSLAVLSRGYGRRSKGVRWVRPTSTAAEVGDEPLQLAQKFGERLLVLVAEKRVEGVRELLATAPTPELLLLDDAFQHRAIQPHIQLLLSDYARLFYEDYPFPAGLLREPRSGAARADAVVITKCPEGLSVQVRQTIQQQVARYTRANTPVFFARIAYGNPLSFENKRAENELRQIRLLCGLANPMPLIEHLGMYFDLVETVLFPDHHDYATEEVRLLVNRLSEEEVVVTTEKDRVKLGPICRQLGCADRFYFIPIHMQFLPSSSVFDEWLREQLYPYFVSKTRPNP